MDFEKLIVWQKATELADLVYAMTKGFAKNETHVLVPQLLRAMNSVPCNVAEGSYRQTKKEFIQHLYIAKGSLSEALTLIEISKRRNYINAEEHLKIKLSSKEFFNWLASLVKKLSYGFRDLQTSK